MYLKGGIEYGSLIHYNSIKEGDNYSKVTKTVVIWILGYNQFKDGPYHETGYVTRLSNNEILSESISYHFIQLPKFIEEVREIKTPEEQWLAYLSCQLDNEELEELFTMNRSIEEINKIVDIVMEDEDVGREIFNRVSDKSLERLIRQKGFEEGEEASKKEIAKKLLEQNVDIKIIAETTGLSIDIIKSL